MTSRDYDHDFEIAADHTLKTMWEFYPNMASLNGLHEYDGQLPDISPASIARRAHQIENAIADIGGFDPSKLSVRNGFDFQLMTSFLHKELFELRELNVPQTNPMAMQWHVELSAYIKRDYAPLDERIESLTRALIAVPTLLSNMRENLGANLSKAVLEASIESYEGLEAFYNNDLPNAVKVLDNSSLLRHFEEARDKASLALHGFIEFLKSLRRNARDEFAIGEEKFLAMLKYGEMVDISLERLLEVGLDDLARNKARFENVAHELDPSKSPMEVMRDVAKLHPSQESLVPETRDMLEKIRQFLIDRDLVTIPSEVRCKVTETPSFMRWATAAMDMPGPFETKATESYYYVTPVEAQWSEQEKEEWLSNLNYAVLENTSIHEAYPGHYVHYLHTKNAPSKVASAFGAYSFWEGWAHYTEEMMVEEGYAEGNLRLLLGQLSDALLRDCRYVCAIRMHTQNMTVREATQFFIDNGCMEELPARKEAQRGTFDPMYLNYTLGKLMILKLREDYRQEQGAAYSLKKFHDTFLSFGAPPIPLVRMMMLKNPGDGPL